MEIDIGTTSSGSSCSAHWHDRASHGFKGRGVAEATEVGGVWWVNRVIVQPENLRGRGIGSRLVEALKQKVKELGGSRLIVCPGGYHDDVESQRRFYERCGFTRSSTDQDLWECDLEDS